MYPKEEILRRLKMIGWDLPYSPEQLYSLLMGEVDSINGFTRTQLYAKIINGFYWHQVRHIVPSKSLPDALSDSFQIENIKREHFRIMARESLHGFDNSLYGKKI